jgi:hypothetical protein
MHKDTFKLISTEYFYLHLDLPTCTDIQQIYNTIIHYAPSLELVLQAMRLGDSRLMEDIKKYPSESYKFINSLEWSADFYEMVQEIDAKLRLRDIIDNQRDKEMKEHEDNFNKAA